MIAAATLLAAAGGLWLALRAIQSRSAGQIRAQLILRILFVASLISILATIGIVLSVIFEAVKFSASSAFGIS